MRGEVRGGWEVRAVRVGTGLMKEFKCKVGEVREVRGQWNRKGAISLRGEM